MVHSINNNESSNLGIQQLNQTTRDLKTSQQRISTGLKINGPKDDAATFAIAQTLRGQSAGAAAAQAALSVGESTVGTALSASQVVTDLLVEIKGKVLQANQEGLSTASRNAINAEFNVLRDQLGTVIATASFNGTNLIESGAQNLEVLADEAGTTITVDAQNLSSVGLGIDTMSLATFRDAQNALSSIDSAIDQANSGAASLGSAALRLENQNDFSNRLEDILNEGIGNLIDADLGEEGANLAANSVKEELGLRTLAIANAGPRAILSLFR